MVSLVPIAHIVAAVFSIIELGLSSYVASAYNGYNGWSGWWSRSPDIVNFIIFNSVWSPLVLAYVGLTPLYLTRFFHKLVSLGLLVITTIFWFAGAIALAVFVGVPHCGANSLCASSQAAVAFAFFIWAIFTFLTVLDTLEAMRSRGHSTKTTHAYPGA
ncbi:Non-classical export protein 2-like protein 1 [Colletotrichum shisoi]|uniref:Non-classical export protein 2-like protein 1 n=1 Tax=Colletotrichum shisoi TaxID=2078593 RepID=A0A5Q4BF38_9PEZI|nr:Non-classical export protein 2-like protein 1 [Colletotrichum shisoi]